MNSKNLLGIALLVLACISFVYAGISYTRRENVLQVGSLTVKADKTETIPLPPIVGGIALVAGVALLTLGRRTA